MLNKAAFLILCFLSVGFSCFADTNDSLVTYPEYPQCIERDYAYGVRVTQGSKTCPLVVYNHCEKSVLSGRIHGGDINRRFCEFAFSGKGVRVDIQVREDVSCYKVFPARLRLKHSFQEGVISVWLDKPEYFGIQLNDDNNTILSILADAPEDPALIPDKNDPHVIYVEKWLDAPERDGNLVTDNSIRQIYVAPGAVLNARLKIKGKGTLVNGRGMILDPMSDIFRYDQMKNKELGFLVSYALDIVVRDVKLVDARTFNYISVKNTKFYNVKAFSSMMCSDGFTICGKDTLIDHAWIYVGDNGLVLSGVNGMTIRNVAIGTSCKAIFPQGTFNKIPAELENIDVFRADEGLLQNMYNGTKDPKKQQSVAVHLKNVSAVDSTLFPLIFSGFDMGELPKTFDFENCSVPDPTGVPLYNSIGKQGVAVSVRNGKKYLFTNNYTINFTNLYIAGSPVTSLPDNRLSGKENMKLSFQIKPTNDFLPMKPDRHEVSYVYPYKVFIGDSLQRLKIQPKIQKDGTLRIEAPALNGSCSYDKEKGIIRYPYRSSHENLVADTLKTKSIWQRAPSYQARLETLFEGKNVIYNLSNVQKNAGMQCNLTDKLLSSGKGTYILKFDAKVKKGTSDVMGIELLSNEKHFIKEVKLTDNWKSYEVKFVSDFDPQVTKLISLWFRFNKNPIENAQLKNLSFRKDATIK